MLFLCLIPQCVVNVFITFIFRFDFRSHIVMGFMMVIPIHDAICPYVLWWRWTDWWVRMDDLLILLLIWELTCVSIFVRVWFISIPDDWLSQVDISERLFLSSHIFSILNITQLIKTTHECLDEVSKTFIPSLVKFETVVWFAPRYLLEYR